MIGHGVSKDLKRTVLEDLYCRYNRREYVRPDPLEFLYDYDDLRDREIVGMVASSLAYGRVSQILKGVQGVLERMKPSPHQFINNATRGVLLRTFHDFRYRFTNGEELATFLFGIKQALEEYGCLYRCFESVLGDDDETVERALCLFVSKLQYSKSHGQYNSLLPCPDKGSACKRLNLYLRWMVRRDDVDPGGWDDVPASKLIMPLDTHIHRFCRMCGITARKQADMRTALEITRYFREIFPEDPVKYDFPLTRLGIRDDTDPDKFFYEWNGR